MEDYKKKYEGLVASLKKAKDDEMVRDDRFCVVIDNIVPGLKESEDEKWISKEIVKYLKEKGDFRSCWIAWLEKQGEQKETLCDKCRKEQPSHSCQDITELGRCALEHQSKQKPVEWSEEDENAIAVIQNIIRHSNKIDANIYTNEIKEKLFSCLKSLKPQPKQEWSKEDEAAYNKALDAYYYKDLNDKDDVVFALKSLMDLIAKHRKTIPVYQRWKPSKEQMKRLQCAIRILKGVNEHTDAKYLEELFDDLKKL